LRAPQGFGTIASNESGYRNDCAPTGTSPPTIASAAVTACTAARAGTAARTYPAKSVGAGLKNGNEYPSHRERQFMQRLRGGGWVKASVAPAGAKLTENLVAEGWVEKRGLAATEITCRLTDRGLAAKKAAVPIYERKSP
jgi:hypothetical protein